MVSCVNGITNGTGPGAPQYVAGSAAASSSGGGVWSSIWGALTAPTAPAAPVYMPQPSSGMSTTTMALLGAGALLAVVLIARK